MQQLAWFVSGSLVLALGCDRTQTGTQPPERPPAPQTKTAEPATVAPAPAASSQAPSGHEQYLELIVQYADNVIGGEKVRLRSYNGKLVGPTIRARPGDTLNIRLVNSLPENLKNIPNAKVAAAELAREMTRNVPPALSTNIPHNFNTTNLHTHGLHVSPAGNSDNVLIAIGPGEEFYYEIKIPTDHPPGTFWYHPHVHGSTSLQVGSGMEGALIIEGDIDRVPAIAAAKEQIFVLQQIPYAKKDHPVIKEEKAGTLESFNRAFLNGAWERGGWRTLINGELEPVIEAAPGEVQRWRIIDAGAEEAVQFTIEGPDKKLVPMHVFAHDGITTGRLDVADRLELYPGYRADVLVKAPEAAGEYLIFDEATEEKKSLLGIKESRKPLARLVVKGARKDMALPAAAELAPLTHYKTIEDKEVTGEQKAHFGIQLTGGGGAYPFALNGHAFDPARAARKLTLGGVDEWTVSSELIGPHIFHIHINPFEVQMPDGSRVWRDTLFIPGGQKYKLRTRYERYVGKFVIHCHILPHEDLGMMEVVEVVPRTEHHH